jgi:SAM-dependent methyltransferase
MGVYDYPRYYEVGFNWDPGVELDFLENCFRLYGRSPTRNVLELGCGTGRLLIELARKGYRVVGVDRSHPMVEYLSAKARHLEITIQLVEGDMENFTIPEKVDAAFCAINTFRYLLTERAALNHLRCVGRALMPGGTYVIDFNLVGLVGSYPKTKVEQWTADEKDVSVGVSHRVIGVPDTVKRRVIEEINLTVKEKGETKTIRTEDPMRTYTRDEFENLVESSKRFKILAWHGPDFDIDNHLDPGPETERVIAVLKHV